MSEPFELSIPPRPRHVAAVRSFFGALAEDCDRVRLAPREVAEVQLVLQEAVINAIRHGGEGESAQSILVRFLLSADRLTIEVHDSGPGFDPNVIPEPDAEALQEGGYGVFIMRSSMDRMETRRESGRFVVSMTRRYRGTGKAVRAGER